MTWTVCSSFPAQHSLEERKSSFHFVRSSTVWRPLIATKLVLSSCSSTHWNSATGFVNVLNHQTPSTTRMMKNVWLWLVWLVLLGKILKLVSALLDLTFLLFLHQLWSFLGQEILIGKALRSWRLRNYDSSHERSHRYLNSSWYWIHYHGNATSWSFERSRQRLP